MHLHLYLHLHLRLHLHCHLHLIYRPRHLPAALVDDRLTADEREELARAIADALEDWGGEELPLDLPVMKPGPNFASGLTYWVGLEGRPSLASFASAECSLIFRTIGQQPGDLGWQRLPSEEWDSHPSYTDFSNYVKKKLVVNDPAER